MRISILERDLPRFSLRDFALDPIDNERVETISESMGAFGNWGGQVARRVPVSPRAPKGLEMVCGEHRRQGDLANGSTHADVFIGDFTDDEALRVYATENASQRGNTATAVLGSVGTALRLCLREQITSSPAASRRPTRGTAAQNRLGIGRPAILAKLQGTGITSTMVEVQLGHLKASGDYDRIVREVIAEAEAAAQAAAEAAAAAEEAARERAAQEERQRAAAEERRRVAAENAARAEEERRLAAEARAAARIDRERQAAFEREARAQRAAETAARRQETARREAEARAAAAAEAEAEAAAAAAQNQEATAETARLAERRQQAQEEAQNRPVEFDMRVATVFTDARHVQTFRVLVTEDPNIRRLLTVEQQLPLAKALIEKQQQDMAAHIAAGNNRRHASSLELTSAYIENNLYDLAASARWLQHFADAAEQREATERLRRAGWQQRFDNYEEQIAGHTRSLSSAASNLLTVMREAQQDQGLVSVKIPRALDLLRQIVTDLEGLGFHREATDGTSTNITNQRFIGDGPVIDGDAIEVRPVVN